MLNSEGAELQPLTKVLTLYQQRRLREAEALLMQLGVLGAESSVLLAQIRLERGNWSGVLECLESLDSEIQKHPKILVLKANANKELDRSEAALAGYDAALRLQPDFVPALTNRAALKVLQGDWMGAEADLDYVLHLKPGFADASFHLGGIYLKRGDFEAGWRLCEQRFDTALCPPADKIYPAARRWQGSRSELSGNRLLLYGEQGLGDIIQFSRFIPVLRDQGIRLILQIPQSLHRLFAEVWPDLELAEPRGVYAGQYDRHCALASLPCLLALKKPCVLPWLKAKSLIQPVERSGKPKVGLVWSGMSVRDLERYSTTRRSIGLTQLAPALCSGVDFISLQAHTRAEDRALMIALSIEDASNALTDFYETASLMKSLDLVVSIDTSVIHLAAAMGVPTWVLLPKVSDYRWYGAEGGSAWYPEVKIFRQIEAGDWSFLVTELAEALDQKFG